MKMAVVQLLALLTVAGLTAGRNFKVQNNLGYTIWVGILGNAGKGTPDNGGFVLNSGLNRIVQVADGWGGRFWARTGSDCGDKLSINEGGGILPVTLAEITLNVTGAKDIYDVSLVDGFNVPVQIIPTVGGGSGYWCTTAGCTNDLNPGCPIDLKVRNGNNAVACKSSCLAYNTDQYCCRGRFNDPSVCRGSPSAVYFKSNCPGAYSYAYDDGTSTFICQDTEYEIIFG